MAEKWRNKVENLLECVMPIYGCGVGIDMFGNRTPETLHTG